MQFLGVKVLPHTVHDYTPGEDFVNGYLGGEFRPGVHEGYQGLFYGSTSTNYSLFLRGINDASQVTLVDDYDYATYDEVIDMLYSG